MSSALLRCLSGIAFVALVSSGEAQAQEGSRVVATVNGESITSAQLDAVIRTQLDELEQRARQLRQAALNKLIDNLLLEQAARKAGTDPTEYLRRNVESAGVTDPEVDQAYERSRKQFPGVLPAEAKYRIRRSLEDNRRAAALNTLLEGLRRHAQITNRLTDDRLAALDFSAQEGPSLGDPGASVSIVEFADFECPYCQAAQPVLKRIMDRWPGRVRLVFRHFPLERHENALPAARAAVCADRQGRFWVLHDRIFAARPPLNEAVIRTAIAGSGLNAAEFDACVKDEQSLERVRRDVILGRTVGVSGTPAFYINRQPVANAAGLETAVERILGDSR